MLYPEPGVGVHVVRKVNVGGGDALNGRVCLLTRARVPVPELAGLAARVLEFTSALTRVTVPGVPRAVDTPELVTRQPRQTLTRARVRAPEVSGLVAGGRALVTLAPARAPVMLQLYAGAVGRAVHVDNHRVRLQLGLLRGAARAQAVQTQT